MEENNPVISIIVPVYNVATYLRECLDSILSQTFSSWECILVDDGSTDESPVICDEYVAKDSRFRVIHKQNGGLSRARNSALQVASGQYIGFVDSDDWIEPEMYERLYSLIMEHNAEISQVGYWKEYKGRRSTRHIVSNVRIIDGAQAMKDTSFGKMPNFCWNKLQQRSVISCGFPEGRNYEDIYVYGRWLKGVKKLVSDPQPMYHYRMRKGSIAHESSAKNRLDFFNSCIDRSEMMRDLLKESKGDKTDSIINAYINKAAVDSSKIIARRVKDEEVRNNSIKRIVLELRQYPLPSIKYINPKTWWRAWLLRHTPGFFSQLMRGVFKLDIDTKHRVAQMYE